MKNKSYLIKNITAELQYIDAAEEKNIAVMKKRLTAHLQTLKEKQWKSSLSLEESIRSIWDIVKWIRT